jgi:hypothetical protein
VFKLNDQEEGGGWFYIVKFKESKISMIKVRDVFNDSSCKLRSQQA